jgi:PAS domain S-box-containing protein
MPVAELMGRAPRSDRFIRRPVLQPISAMSAQEPGTTGAGRGNFRHPLADAESLRLLIDSTTDYAIFLLDPLGNVLSWNAGAQRMQGYRPEEIIGQHFSVFYTDEANQRRWPQQELEFASRDGRFEDEGWRVRKDGTLFWANVVITALRDDSGKLVGFGKVSRDLSERRRAEQELRESEERMRLIIESTVDYAIFMLDPQGYVASWNPGAERIKGYRADEIIGKHFSVFYPEEVAQSGWPAEELERATAAGRFEDEGWRIRKDGSRFWANVIISPLRGADGKLRGFAKVTRDVGQRKKNEERIEQLTRELEARVVELARSNRELAQQSAENEGFVFSVSHDLRAPLVNLQGFSHELALTTGSLEQLLRDPAVPEDIRRRGLELIQQEMQESIGFIRNAVKHLGNIIDGLLRLSRVGRIEYASQVVDTNAVVAEILASLHSTIVQSGATVTVTGLPSRKSLPTSSAMRSRASMSVGPGASRFPPAPTRCRCSRSPITVSASPKTISARFSECSNTYTTVARAAKAWASRSCDESSSGTAAGSGSNPKPGPAPLFSLRWVPSSIPPPVITHECRALRLDCRGR